MKRRSFTLVELLVVMVIIGILASLLLVAVSRTRGSGRRAKCVEQLRQIGLAVHQYTDENGGFLPTCSRLGPREELHLPSLPQILLPTIGDERLFRCPDDHGAKAYFPEYGTSYEWNTFLNGRLLDRATLTIVGVEIQSPLLGDAEAFHGPPGRNVLWPDGHVDTAVEVIVQ